MKKKLLITLLALITVFACAFGLSACGGDSDDGGNTDTEQGDGSGENENNSGTTHTHNLAHTAAKEATCTEEGNVEYWYCSGCGKYFADENATTEITELTVPAGHDYVDYICTRCHVWAQNAPFSVGLKYEKSDDSYEVNGIGDCTDTELNIPAYYDGLPVTLIGEDAFGGCTSLTRVNIPASVKFIYADAFRNCTSLASITLSDSVTAIGEEAFTNTAYYNNEENWENSVLYIGKHLIKAKDTISGNYEIKEGTLTIAGCAFWKCNSLVGVTTPNSMALIEYSAFGDCSALENITLSDSVTSIGEDAFTNTAYYNNESNWQDGVLYIGKHLIKAKTTISSNYQIKQGTLTTADYAFSDCSSLESIAIPNSVTTIGEDVFNGCSSLASVTIPVSVTTIGEHAFYGCRSLTSITIPAGVTTIGNLAFCGCRSLTSITIPAGVTTIGNLAFGSCISLSSITIPDSVTTIGNSAFEDCTSLTNITIPNSVTTIGDETFSGCKSLTDISVSENNKVFCAENGVLFSKDKTVLVCYPEGKTETSYSIPDSVTSIGYGAFYGCSSLMSIAIPAGVTTIGGSAFGSCISLSSITIPDSVTTIGSNSFEGCISLESITIPDSVTSIGYGAFRGCTSLASISIPDSVTIIGGMAFGWCSSLESITIPDSVTSISSSAFYNTAYYNNESNWQDGVLYIGKHLIKAKTTISGNYQIKQGTLTVAEGAFWDCTSLTSITISDSVTTIDNYAFRGCTSLASISIPDSVTKIGGGAFYGCSLVASITIPDSVTTIGGTAFKYCTSLVSATFENTSGWKAGNKSKSIISSADLADPATAAKYLTDTYCGKTWKRS